MCGGGDQTVTQRTELDPELRRLLYGGALTSAHGLHDPNAPRPAATGAAALTEGGGGGMDRFGGGGGMDSFGGSLPSQGGFSGSESNHIASGGLYAMGGPVQSGIASMQPSMPMTQNMPMMNGALPNLSDREVAATLAMAQMRPQMMMGMGSGGMPQQAFAMGGYVEGPGTGTSDDIPATIYQDGIPVQNAALSDGEFVMTERAVRNAGGGDRDRGAARMYEMMRMFEQGGRV